MKLILRFSIAFIALFLMVVTGVAQPCQIQGFSEPQSITCGDCATLSAFGNGTGGVAFQEDFNSGSPQGWQFTQTVTIGNNTCGQPSPDGTDFMWMGDASDNPRDMTTQDMDLTLGGTVCFEMRYSVQGDASPCEGPDEPDEGVYIQYSTDGGATWNTMEYYDPDGGNNSQLTNWNSYCVAIPAGAQTGTTQIRWHQDDVSGAEYDHWGIDNVEIILNDPNYEITWLHDGYGYGLGNSGGDNPTPVCPTVNTDYTVEITDGTNTCTDVVTVTVTDPILIIEPGNDTTICPGECITLDAEAYELISPASTPTFENNEFSFVGSGNAGVNINVTNLNTTSMTSSSITQVCINSFNFSGTQYCSDWGGCNCNGQSISFGDDCDLDASGFDVWLNGPGGCQILLVPNGTATGTDYQDVCFVPAGGQDIHAGGFPASGDWDPEEPFSDLNGCNPNGVWELEFDAPGGIGFGAGSLTGWSISFDDPAIIDVVTYNWSPTTFMTNENTLSPTVCPTTDITYNLEATDLDGCLTESADIAITMDVCCALKLDALTLVEPSCGNNDGSIEVQTSGAITGLVFSIDGGTTTQTSNTFTGLGAGNYTVWIDDDNNCSTDSLVVFVDPGAPTIDNLNGIDATCGNNDGQIDVSASGGTPVLQYSFDGGTSYQAGSNASNLAGGLYDVVVRDAANCTVTASVSITGPPGITATADVISDYNGADVSCNGDNDGAATAVITGGASPLNYVWSNGQLIQNATSLSAGPVSVTVTDANGCESISSTTISEPNQVTVTTSCNNTTGTGASDGSSVSASGGGIGVLTYAWSPAPASGQTGATANNLPAGTYTVTVSDANGCEAIASCVINDPNCAVSATASVVSNYNGEDVSCNGLSDGEVTASMSGSSSTNFTYMWSNGAITNSVTGLVSGNYTVTITDENDCEAIANVSVSEPALLTSSSACTAVSFVGTSDGSSTSTPSGGVTPYIYSWLPAPAAGQTGATANNLPEGSYTVTVTDNNGCEATSTCVVYIAGCAVTVTTMVTSNYNGEEISCNGLADGEAMASMQGGTPGFTYLWDNGQTDATATGLSAGTYNVTVNDNSGCTEFGIVSVSEPALLAVNNSCGSASAAGASDGSSTANATGGTGALTYTWSPAPAAGQVGATANNLPAGTYTVTVSDNNGCEATSSCVVAAGCALTVTTTVTNALCSGENSGVIATGTTGGATPYVYNWDNSSSTTETATGLSVGNTSFTVTDNSGCTATGTESISEPSSISLATSATNETNFGSCDGSTTVNPSGGAAPYTIVWSHGGTTQTATGICAGAYTVTVTDNNGCEETANVNVQGSGCAAVVDFNTWTQQGDPSQGNWVVQGGGSSVNQTINGEPTFYVSPFDLINVEISGNFMTNNADDDFMGFVFGYQDPIGTPYDEFETYLFDWKQGTQTTAQEGMTLNYIDGTIPAAQNNFYFWAHNDDATFSVLDTNYGVGTGWVMGNNHQFTLIYTLTQITIIVDGNTVFTQTGCFEPGRFGFYNYSQPDVTYSNFSYKIAVDFTISSPDVCVGEPAEFTFLDNCVSNFNFAMIDYMIWNYGDGESDTINNPTMATINPTHIYDSPGTYNIEMIAVDPSGCTDTSYQTITVTQPSLALAGVIDADCYGASTGSIDVTPSGGTTPYTFVWNTGDNSEDIANVPAGDYDVILTDGMNCNVSLTANVNEAAEIIFSSSSVDETCSSQDGSASVSAAGGTGTLNYLWDTSASNQTTASATGLSTGNYDVTISDVNSCSVQGNVTVGNTSPFTPVNATVTQVVCNGNADGTATVVDMTGGVQPYTYLWESGETTATLTGLAIGQYVVSTTDNNGCQGFTTVTITEPSAVSITSSSSNISCFAGSDGVVTTNGIGGIPGYSASWSNGTTTLSVTGLVAGNYAVTLSDQNGCSILDNFTLSEPSQVTVSASSTNPECNGYCTGNSVATGAGGISPYSFSWSNGQNGASSNGLCAGDYSVTITDDNGCSASVETTLTEPSAVTTTFQSNDATCNNSCDGFAVVVAGGGTGVINYNWSSPISTTNPLALNLCSGIYQLSVSDGNGCVVPVETFTIDEPSALVITNTSSIPTNCNQNDGSVSVDNVIGGLGSGYSYQWSDNQGTPQATGILAGIYCVTVHDDASSAPDGCFVSTCVTVTNIDGPSVSASSTDVTCSGDCDGTSNAFATPNGGSNIFSYQWGSNANNQVGANASNLCAGNYTVTVTDDNGCSAVTITEVIQPTMVEVSASVSDAVICFNECTNVSAQATGGNGGPYSYDWNVGSGQIQTVCPSQENTFYEVVATDAFGCVSAASFVMVTMNPELYGYALGDNTICQNGDTYINAIGDGGNGGPYNYSWSDGQLGSSISVSPSNYPTPEQYIVTISDGCSPSVTDTVVISFYTTPAPLFSPDSADGCVPYTTTIQPFTNTLSNVNTCLWEMEDGTTYEGCNLIQHEFYEVGGHDVTLSVISNDGCGGVSTQVNVIQVHGLPEADFISDPNPTDMLNTQIDFEDRSDQFYGTINQWDWSYYNNDQQTLLGEGEGYYSLFTFPSDTGHYPVNLQVTNIHGCKDDTTRYVEIDGIYELYIPNAFTPNGNGLNDYFYPTGVGIATDPYKLEIYDRWGERIFESLTPSEGWDGIAYEKGGGQIAQNGVYVWKLYTKEGLTQNKKEHTYVGTVTLIR